MISIRKKFLALVCKCIFDRISGTPYRYRYPVSGQIPTGTGT